MCARLVRDLERRKREKRKRKRLGDGLGERNKYSLHLLLSSSLLFSSFLSSSFPLFFPEKRRSRTKEEEEEEEEEEEMAKEEKANLCSSLVFEPIIHNFPAVSANKEKFASLQVGNFFKICWVF